MVKSLFVCSLRNKRDKNRQTGGKPHILDSVDQLILEILGHDSPAVRGIGTATDSVVVAGSNGDENFKIVKQQPQEIGDETMVVDTYMSLLKDNTSTTDNSIQAATAIKTPVLKSSTSRKCIAKQHSDEISELRSKRLKLQIRKLELEVKKLERELNE